MKKILLIFLIGFFTLSLSTNVYSTCPAGYSQAIYQVQINNNCWYNVEICYKCVGVNIGELMIFGWGKVNSQCQETLDPNQVYQLICNRFYTSTFIRSLCGAIPPCSKGDWVYYNYVYQKCWQKEGKLGGIWYEHCSLGDCYCLRTYRFCYDEINDRMISEFMWQDYSCDYGHECTLHAWDVNDPPQGVTTDCFILQTPCNAP